MILKNRTLLLVLSLLGLYLMPHIMKRIVPVGVGFALLLIGSSRPVFTKRQLLKYAAYMGVSVGTYYLLFQNQPWEALVGWMPDDVERLTGVPVSVCSILMALAGGLLLTGKTEWRKYLLATLLIQIPLSMVFTLGPIHAIFETLARVLRYTDEQIRAHQAWQFMWMVNYYLPVYLWSRSGFYSGNNRG